MPDVVELSDPFQKVALDKPVVTTLNNTNDISIYLDNLQDRFIATSVENGLNLEVINRGIKVQPGVYILGNDIQETAQLAKNKSLEIDNFKLGEYVAPDPSVSDF